MLRQTVRPTEIELHLSPCGSSTWRRWETYCRQHGHSSNRGKSSAAKQLEWAKRLSWSSEYRLNGELSRSRHQEIDLDWSKGQSIIRRWEAAKGSAGATSTSVSPKRHREYLRHGVSFGQAFIEAMKAGRRVWFVYFVLIVLRLYITTIANVPYSTSKNKADPILTYLVTADLTSA